MLLLTDEIMTSPKRQYCVYKAHNSTSTKVNKTNVIVCSYGTLYDPLMDNCCFNRHVINARILRRSNKLKHYYVAMNKTCYIRLQDKHVYLQTIRTIKYHLYNKPLYYITN